MNDQNNEQTEVLKEILKWMKFAGLKEVKNTLKDFLETDAKKLVYYLSDGSRSAREIARFTGVGKSTVAELWQVWLRNGLGDNIAEEGGKLRFKRSFNPIDFGVEIPASQTHPKQIVDLKQGLEEENEDA